MKSEKRPQRTLRRVVDVTTWSTLTSDALLQCGPDDYQRIRRLATRARNEGRDHFVCEECGFAVYAPREPRTRLPYWRHRKGAPRDCPWWTGDPSTVDEASARQFAGAQESALHVRVKRVVGELLEADPNTAPGSIVVDKYLAGISGNRRPDVRADYCGKKIAFEVQLATTQIPVIDARESFYAREGHHLLWLTWNFAPVPRTKLRTAFEDIFYSHNKNIFSLDEETIRLSRERRKFYLRAFWEEQGSWKADLYSLPILQWPSSGLPYAREPHPTWQENFLKQWLEITTENGTSWPARNELLTDLFTKIGAQSIDLAEINEIDIPALLNCLLSVKEGRPIGSRQTKIVELVNTFFSSNRRMRYARIVTKALRVTRKYQLLNIPSVSAKINAALKAIQDGPDSNSGKIALLLFPELFVKIKSLDGIDVFIADPTQISGATHRD